MVFGGGYNGDSEKARNSGIALIPRQGLISETVLSLTQTARG